MLYIDLHTAEPTVGQININAPRLIRSQDGQENSADGTGPEETCAKGGAASNGSTTCRRISFRDDPFERPYCHHANCPACLPCSACAVARAASGACGHRGSTR